DARAPARTRPDEVAAQVVPPLALVCPLFAGDLHTGLATTFGPSSTDPQNPHDTLACTRHHRRLNARVDRVVASYVLPCGTRLLVWNPRTHRSVVVTVADRGPRRSRR